MQEIDLVVTWVNGQDPKWRKAFGKYAGNGETEEYLYRDWEWMRYWFRGVEKNLPWIRRVHFITCGHLPDWLNAEHAKLNIIRHDEYIPDEYLPTFSSHTIEWNLHRIGELSERFILCNDDMLFIRQMEEEEYFKGGLPCDALRVCPITESRSKKFNHLLLNNMVCLNRRFDMRECANKYPELWFSDRYDEKVREDNRCALRWGRFPGLYYDHMPMPLLKSSIETVWQDEGELLDQVCRRRFRDFYTDVNIYLARFYALARGKFVPHERPNGKYCLVSAPDEVIADALGGNYPLVCLNEAGYEVDFQLRRSYIHALLDSLFPEPSSYESDNLQ